MNINDNLGSGLVSSPLLETVCQVLGEVLNAGVDIHRCQAAKALGKIGAADAVQPLIGALLDEDEDVRSDAAHSLLELADPRACDQLFENLQGDPCTEVKLSAIETLAILHDDRVIPLLRRLVRGRDAEIIWDEEEFYATGWDDWVDVQIKAIEALAKLQAMEAVPDIVAAIHDENALDIAKPAFRALASMGVDGLTALAGFMHSDEPRLRRRAASVLAGFDNIDVRAPMAQAVADPSPDVRLAVLQVRGKLVPDDPVLAELLQDEDAGIRAEAANLIGRFHTDTLQELLDDPVESVQTAALLAFVGEQDVVVDEALTERLVQGVNAASVRISVAAATSFAAVAPDLALPELTGLLANTDQPVAKRLGALKGLRTIGNDAAISALIAVIDDDARQIRLETMSALAGLAQADSSWPNRAASALLASLTGVYDPEVEEIEEIEEIPASAAEQEEVAEPEPEIQADVAEVFPTSTLDAILDDAPGLASAVGLPEQGIELSAMDMERLAIARRVVGKKKMAVAPDVLPHEDIRRFAARVLGDLDHAEVAEALAQALQSDDLEISMAAADSLARIGARGNVLDATVTAMLLGAFDTPERDLKLLLIRALAATDSDEVSERLADHLGNEDSFLRNEAICALAGKGKFATRFAALLPDPDPAVRLSAAQAFARDGGADKVEKLVGFSCSFEGYHSRNAARLLRDIDAQSASAAYIGILGDPESKKIWSVAIEALEVLNQPQEQARVT